MFKLCIYLPIIIPSGYFPVPIFYLCEVSYKSYTRYSDNPCFLLKTLNTVSSMVMTSVYTFITAFINLYGNDLFTCLSCTVSTTRKRTVSYLKWAQIPAYCLAQSRNPINYSVKSKDSCSLVSQEQKSGNSLIFTSLCKFLKRWQS